MTSTRIVDFYQRAKDSNRKGYAYRMMCLRIETDARIYGGEIDFLPNTELKNLASKLISNTN